MKLQTASSHGFNLALPVKACPEAVSSICRAAAEVRYSKSFIRIQTKVVSHGGVVIVREHIYNLCGLEGPSSSARSITRVLVLAPRCVAVYYSVPCHRFVYTM